MYQKIILLVTNNKKLIGFFKNKNLLYTYYIGIEEEVR